MPLLEGDDSYEFIDILDMPPLERKGLKTLIPSKLLARLPTLLAQINARNNSQKLKNEIRQMLYLLYQHGKITKKVYDNLFKSL